VQVFPLGVGRTVDQRKVRCEGEDFRAVLSDLATRRDPVRLTVEHGEDPLWGSRAAGECSVLTVRSAGLWAEDPHWTAPALAEIRSGARRGISPTFYGVPDADGFIRPRILRDISLCSVPNLDGMELVEAVPSRFAAASMAPLQRMRAAVADVAARTADSTERRALALRAIHGIGVGLSGEALSELAREAKKAVGCRFDDAAIALTTEDAR
jgi:hypothetical protein